MATRNQINALYQELLGRPADAEGLNYWANSGQSLDVIRSNILLGQEAQTYQRKSQISQLYQNILGRAPDAEGLNYWLNSNQDIDTIRKNIELNKQQQMQAASQYDPDADPRFAASQGQYVTIDADAGGEWRPITVGAPIGQYETINADAGGQWVENTAAQQAAMNARLEADRQAELQAAAAFAAANPLLISGNQINTKYGLRDISLFKPLVQPGQQVTGSTLTQLIDPATGMAVYLSDPNNPYSFTYDNTGIPAIGGTLEEQAALYIPPKQNGVFGTLGSDLLEGIKDPYFRNFAIAAAAMAAAAALAPAAGGSVGGTTAGGAGATAFPVALGDTIVTSGGLGATGAGGFGSTLTALGTTGAEAAAGFGSVEAALAAAAAGASGATGAGASGVTGSTAGGFLGGSGDILAGAAGSGGGTLGAAGTAAATTAGTGLLDVGKEVLSGTTGDIIKGAVVAGGLVAADALKPDQEPAKGGGLTAAELKALVDAMPSMIGQYAAQAQNGTGLNAGGYNQGTNQALAALFPTFRMPTQGQSFGAGRFGSNYNPAPFTSLV